MRVSHRMILFSVQVSEWLAGVAVIFTGNPEQRGQGAPSATL